MLEALEHFDPKRGVSLKLMRATAFTTMMQCLRSLECARCASWGRKIEAARASLPENSCANQTAEEMAKELAIPLDNYFRVDQQVNDALLLSLEDLSVLQKRNGKVPTDYNQNIHFDPVAFVENRAVRRQTRPAQIDGLPEREWMVVTLYYHEELTLREIGEVLNLSEGRICQIFGQAVGRLRGALGVVVKTKDGAKTRRRA